jgi:hypothetical protein
MFGIAGKAYSRGREEASPWEVFDFQFSVGEEEPVSRLVLAVLQKSLNLVILARIRNAKK